MALFDDGQICYLCRTPMTGDQDLIGFTYVATGNPIVRPFDDSVCHRSCLSEWSERDSFVLGWNKEAMYCLGLKWFLDINSRGEVHYLTAFDRFRYTLRLKRSKFLPQPISRRWPLLKFGLHNGCKTPFTLHYKYSYAHSWPSAEQLGVSIQLAHSLAEWLAEYDALCAVERTDDPAIQNRWRKLSVCEREHWNSVCDEIGHRYRVVCLAPFCILEPESRINTLHVK